MHPLHALSNPWTDLPNAYVKTHSDTDHPHAEPSEAYVRGGLPMGGLLLQPTDQNATEVTYVGMSAVGDCCGDIFTYCCD